MSAILLRLPRPGCWVPMVLVLQCLYAGPVFPQAPQHGQPGAPTAQADIILAKIVSGRASLDDIKSGLRTGKSGDIANMLHALYVMRDSLIIRKLLHSMWYERRDLHPDIAWHRLQSPVVRVALASTLNRILRGNTREFLDYIRGQKDHEIFLVRSQVAVALGINGELQDIDILSAYVLDESDHVAKSAVTGLAFMYRPQARDELVRLLELQPDDSKRARLIRQALLHAYDRVHEQVENQ